MLVSTCKTRSHCFLIEGRLNHRCLTLKCSHVRCSHSEDMVVSALCFCKHSQQKYSSGLLSNYVVIELEVIARQAK